MRAAEHFAPGEFPASAHDCDPMLIVRLDEFRSELGVPVHPSRDPGGWVRDHGSQRSRHHAIHADAGDVFPEGDALHAFLVAQQFFGGVGIYFDTNRSALQPGPMLHVDLRPGWLVWARNRGRYVYPANGGEERELFWKWLHEHATES